MMIKLKWIVLIFILFLSANTYGQIPYLMGKVINKQFNQPIENANIFILLNNHISFITHSDSIGKFKFPIYNKGENIKIKITFQKIESIFPIEWQKEHETTGILIFKLDVPNKLLKEIKINVSRRYHDTTKIDLSNKKFERSIMIEDLFSKGLGFYKDENGQLYYKGKIVSTLLVNGREFFGNNNMDIYKLLPALIINSIQVIETNVDSVTNTTTLRPTTKVNLLLKDKYNHGEFGDASIGGGASKRYLGNLDLYTYKNAEQISLTINSNNINKSNLQDPSLDFSGNGNNLTSSIAQLNYRNTWKKIDLSVSIKGKEEDQNTFFNTQRNDEIVKQFSNISTISDLKAYKIENSYFHIKYNIDPLNTFSLNQSGNYNNAAQTDSSNYAIITDTNSNHSSLKRRSHNFNSLYSTDLRYERRFSSLKGRLFSFEINNEKHLYKIDESDIYNLGDYMYNVNSKRIAEQNVLRFTTDFTEPLGEDAYAKAIASYANEKNNYNTQLNGDTVINNLNNNDKIVNHYYQLGINFHKTFKSISFDQNITETLNRRDVLAQHQSNELKFSYLNFDSKLDYKTKSGKSISIGLQRNINYPSIEQLTSINTNTFDALYQQEGNINLKPEVDNKISIDYSVKSSELQQFSYFARIDYYQFKIGINISTTEKNKERAFFDNLGSGNSGLVGFFVVKQSLSGNYLRAATNFNYSESPVILDGKTIMNTSFVLNQSFSGKSEWISQVLTSYPTLALSYGKYYYGSNIDNQFNLIYTEKESLAIKKFTFNAYGLFNVTRNVNTMHSFGINAEVVKTIFNKYGKIWIKAYDIFNTYHLLNNEISPSYIQTSNYLNLQRYVLIGITYKFNNIK